MRKIVWLGALAALLGAACAPAPRTAPAPAAADTAGTRWQVRPVPVTQVFRRALEGGTRSATGAPGPRYWQQAVSYRIEATLDPETAELRGRERIVYRNRSPQPLRSVVLNLYQNVFAEGSRRNRAVTVTGGVTLERVAAQGVALAEQPRSRIGVVTVSDTAPVGYAVQETLARLVLPRAVAPGDSAVLEIEWRHRVPPAGSFRTAWEDALGGRAFNVAQWYPQVAVLDDVAGWDATPYLGDGEFYLEYGDFDVAITLPAGWIVGATGTLANPGEVLSDRTRERLARAASSDEGVAVVTGADLGTATRARTGTHTWRFRADSVRDFAFAASNRYLWDAARVRVAGRDVVVHALYRPGAPGWERASQYGQHAVSYFSNYLIPYLYPQVTIAEGPIGGMEYPMLVFIPRPSRAEDLYAVIAHEVGHEWFPMMVGQNEAAYAWMDEGLTSFFEDEAREAFFPGTDAHGETRAGYLAVAGSDTEVPLMRHTDLVSPYGARTVAAYRKPAALMTALRGVVGDSAFRAGMRTYASEWLFKHPYPWDFFHTFERVAGRDLDWFWYPWWFETGVLDLSVDRVEQVNGGVRVTFADRGDVPVPTTVRVTYEGGTSTEGELPIELWTVDRLRTASLTLPALGAVTRVEIDPDHVFPDVDRTNNVWTPAGAGAEEAARTAAGSGAGSGR
ncbi:MAG TPA: M1 family metallopeptidase [Longimicrobium sp.]|nr:M1 family metallopeptidase [Longimicrobium sp.]